MQHSIEPVFIMMDYIDTYRKMTIYCICMLHYNWIIQKINNGR